MNIQEIAQKLVDDLNTELSANEHRKQGVVLLYERLVLAEAEEKANGSSEPAGTQETEEPTSSETASN
jgi:hypothetical protein